ncbi:F-actin-monooxygenase mical2b isoform X6 [Denticeps clupeoides]|uniref:F-actin-monooxygenase mical2b isoform X6 n=1 Tax=Denticeps clupeoides TaxID=299321 RepID=UPI0010A53432|nr:protein-methionine sulfoxide oxidase mical2b-like isoform X6 [Denticeps clupeoides]
MGETEDERTSQAGQLFENFVQASTCKGTMQAFCILCRQLELDPSNYTDFYHSLKSAVTSWKAKGLWSKLDKRASHKEYMKGKACTDTKCLVIGSGPCGLRTAIELAFLGAKVVVIEKRDTFSRNNVLHLWPYTIHDLRGLGAKKFYGKFCAGSIDHISIRQLQLMLLKIALIVGVEVHVNVEFIKLLEPPEDQPNEGPGWRAEIRPAGHPISDFDFDVVVGADGRRSTLDGFRRKEFRGKLAIAITANFVNRNTTAEAKVEEISGVAFIFNQKFFLDLKEETGIDLENIVYYKDNTHYFVMTAKKQSLLDKGVIIHDYIETERLLSSQNVDQEALLSYAREAADFGTNYQLPSLDYAINHYGQPDVAMFDFTCMYASENAALVRENFRHQLLVALVGDSLLEPFWPMGTGCARGFLAAFDTAWMVRGWAQGRAPLEILAERESIYRLLPQTTPENINKNFDQYTIDPSTRYPNLNANCVRPHQVQHLYMNGDQDSCSLQGGGPLRSSVSLSRQELEIRPRQLLSWCQKQTQGYRGVEVTDLTSSWKSGLALCALIHSYRPDLIDFDSLNEADSSRNNQLAFDVAEREFGIQPVTTGAEIAAEREPDKLLMVLYLSKFYEIFYATAVPAAGVPHERDENNDSSTAATAVYNLINFTLPRKRIPKEEKLEDKDATNRKRRKGSKCLEELVPSQSAAPPAEGGNARENKVRSMATQLLAKFEENAASGEQRRQSKEFPQNLGGSDICSFCQKRVYVMERLSAEGHFFHRECFRCSICRCTLRLGGHAFDSEQGKFYCKMHFSQAKVKSKTRRRTIEGSGVTLLDGHNLSTSPGSLQSHASDGWNQETHRGRLDPSMVVEESGDAQHIMSSENLGSSEADREQTDRTSGPFASGKSQKEAEPGASDCKGGLSKGSSRSHFWRRKIRSTLPLILVKTFDHGKTKGLPEADSNSDFEDISALTSTGDPERSSQENNPAPTEVLNYRQDQISSELQSPSLSLVSPRKKLVLSASEKEKLLDWDLGAPESEVKPRKFSFRQNDTKSETLPQNPEPASMTPPNSPPLSTFQFWASTLRRSFGASGNSISVTGVTKRPKAPKVRPVSEGPLYFTSLFGSASQEQQSCPAPAEGQLGRQKSGSDLTTLLEQVALSTKPMGTSKDDMASLPPRKLNFFSSLRVKRREGEVRRGVDNQKDIWTILSKFRNKGSSQREEEACCSSSSDEEQHTEPQKPQRSSVERQRKRQEKLVQQQARREQLKRLHRAQVIQRQLEEVEEKQRALEEKGVALEKILRGETGDQSSDEHQLLQTWFKLVLEKNKLERYESELMIFAQELELEDTQSQLQRDLRSRMAMDDSKKSPEDLKEEQELLVHIMQVVEKRDQLVSLLEEQRLRERAEDRDLESMVLSRGYQVHWT